MNWLFLILVALYTLPGQAKVVERIVAIVNDQIITLTDVESYKKRLSSDGLVDEALLRLTDKDRLLKDRNALISHLIDERIIDSEVKKRGMEATIERVEQEIRSISSRQGLTRQQLKEILQKRGVNFSDYQDFIRSSIERKGIIEKEVSSKIRISDEDIAAYYLARKGPSKGQAYEFSLAHILFLIDNGGESAARARAKQVLAKVQQGQTFESLAEQYSEDPNFAQGGFLGQFKSGEMLKEMETAVRDLALGQTTDVIKTRAGYHVIKVLKKSVIADPEMMARQEEIHNILFAEAFKRQFRTWLDQRREQAFIRINEPTGNSAG